jgi:hypothetical protein
MAGGATHAAVASVRQGLAAGLMAREISPCSKGIAEKSSVSQKAERRKNIDKVSI